LGTLSLDVNQKDLKKANIQKRISSRAIWIFELVVKEFNSFESKKLYVDKPDIGV